MAPLADSELSLLRKHVYSAELVDGHAHNLVDHRNSSFPFVRCFSEAEDEALLFAPHTLSFKVFSSAFSIFMKSKRRIRQILSKV